MTNDYIFRKNFTSRLLIFFVHTINNAYTKRRMFMDSCTENKADSKCCSLFKKLCSAKIKDDIDISMTITAGDNENDDTDKTPCFTKRIKSSSEFSLLKALGVFATVMVVLSSACGICQCFKKK